MFRHLVCGKTTILRDLIRKISSGIEQIGFKGVNVGVVDERGEIAAMYRGVPQNDIGLRTDVLDNVSKEVRTYNAYTLYGSKGYSCR